MPFGVSDFHLAILKCIRDDAISGLAAPKWSDDDLTSMFNPTFGNGWSIGEYWQQATKGIRTIVPDLHGWYHLTGTESTQGFTPRSQMIPMAISAASDVDFSKYDGIVVWVYPPDCDAGAWFGTSPYSALLDSNGYQDYLAHEVGHVLGFMHSFGPNDYDYGDPYCIMSAETFGGRSPCFSLTPQPISDDGLIDQIYWVYMGPAASGAELLRFLPNEFGPAVLDLVLPEGPFGFNAATFSLAAMEDPGDPFASGALKRLATITPCGVGYPYTIEFRNRMKWDQGIATTPLGAPATLVIHQIAPTTGSVDADPAGRPVFVGEVAAGGNLPAAWSNTDSTLTVLLTGTASDYSSATITVVTSCPSSIRPAHQILGTSHGGKQSFGHIYHWPIPPINPLGPPYSGQEPYQVPDPSALAAARAQREICHRAPTRGPIFLRLHRKSRPPARRNSG